MSEKYDFKLNAVIKKIVEVYLKVTPDPLEKYPYASSYLRDKIHEEANRILDFLEQERETNPEVQKVLGMEEYKDVLDALESNSRF